MDNEAQGYVDALHGLWDQVRGAIKDLPADALNWKPQVEETNSAAIMVSHMCGVATSGVINALTGAALHRVRDEEFQATAGNAESNTVQVTPRIDETTFR